MKINDPINRPLAYPAEFFASREHDAVELRPIRTRFLLRNGPEGAICMETVADRHMNEVLFELQMFGQTVVVTPWKLIGYAGVAVFAGRWVVQLLASYRLGRSHFPRAFWYMSLAGSLLLLSYFTFSDKNDSVGVMSNLFPALIAGYNLFLEERRLHLTRHLATRGSP